MLRLFLALVVTDGSLLVASFVLGLWASDEPRGPHAIWRGIHLLFSLMTTMAAVGMVTGHGMVPMNRQPR